MKQSSMTISTPSEDTFQLDASRLFYYENGQFRHTWDAVDVDTTRLEVHVIWASGKEPYRVTLRGSDALKFLEITRSRFVRTFLERLGAR